MRLRGGSMTLAVICMILALACYSSAIFSEKYTGRILDWILAIFIAGFMLDSIGTLIMKLKATTGASLTPHSVFGFSAFAIMALHLGWALCAKYFGGAAEQYFSKFSLYAWFIWLTAFILGIPKVIG